MRVREEGTGRILDKDLYRKGADLETVRKAYEEFYRRLTS
jgi:phosphoribosylaminoimidazole-succinocarboxamide synthase (EC 6.3.2.6)